MKDETVTKPDSFESKFIQSRLKGVSNFHPSSLIPAFSPFAVASAVGALFGR
jgi:hypothetical protein